MGLQTTKVAVCDKYPENTLVIPHDVTGNGKIVKYVKAAGWAVLDIGQGQQWFSPQAVSELFSDLPKIVSNEPELAEFDDEEEEDTDELAELEVA